MPPPDIATTLRKVSALRSLCLRLPHVPTPAEKRLLERFEALTAAPTRATAADMEAIAVGWSGWGRGGHNAGGIPPPPPPPPPTPGFPPVAGPLPRDGEHAT